MEGRDRRPAPDRRKAVAEASPKQAAPGKGVEGLDDLVAGAEGVRKRVQPDVHPRPDIPEQLVDGHAADAGGHGPEQNVARPGRCDVQQKQEDQEEEQRGAEIALYHHDAEGDGPHGDHRREIRQRRQAKRSDPRGLLHEQRPVLGEVAGQEDDEEDLEQFGGLTRQRPDLQVQPLAVDVATEEECDQEQADADGSPRVLVSPQPRIVANRDGEAGDDGHADEEPHQLRLRETAEAAGEVLRQSFHEEEPDPAKEADRRQQDLVGSPAGDDQHDVRREE